jgi:endonuclease/exonuclease/phosphatase family metal-dependent hydrolase
MQRALAPALIALAFAPACTMHYGMQPKPDPACPTKGESATAIDWYEPEREGDVKSLDAWCRTVGPVVVDSLPAHDFGPHGTADSLIVVTWNVHGGAADPLSFLSEELGLSCTSAGPNIGPGFGHFVLLLQEVFRRSDSLPVVQKGSTIPPPLKEEHRPGERIDIAELAERCGLALIYIPSMRNGASEEGGTGEDRGNAILSTLPLSDFIAVELPFEAQRRVGVAATIHSPTGDSLRVVSLHLDVSSSLERTLRTGNSTRLRQGLGLVEALRDVELSRAAGYDPALAACYPECPPGAEVRYTIATIAAGDFNTWSNDDTALLHLREHFPDSPDWDGLPTKNAYPADHILFREAADGGIDWVEGTYRRIEDRYHSDHWARSLLMRWP